MTKTDYWIEALADVFDEHGIKATPEQIALVAREIENIRDGEQYLSAPVADPSIGEINRLKSELRKEQDKRGCTACGGFGGTEHPVGSSHWSFEVCLTCRGSGKA